jgi:hypothetical protein
MKRLLPVAKGGWEGFHGEEESMGEGRVGVSSHKLDMIAELSNPGCTGPFQR